MNPPSIVYYKSEPQSNPPFSVPSVYWWFCIHAVSGPTSLKRLHHYARPSERDLTVNWDGVEAQLRSGVWNRLPVNTPSRDVVLGWASQAVGLSPFDYDAFGARLS